MCLYERFSKNNCQIIGILLLPGKVEVETIFIYLSQNQNIVKYVCILKFLHFITSSHNHHI